MTESILRATIAELRRQNVTLIKENETLKRRLAKWPKVALEHALKARADERHHKHSPTGQNPCPACGWDGSYQTED